MAVMDPLDKEVLKEMAQMTSTLAHMPEITHLEDVCQAQYTS
jgi:hypothetical protein